MSGIKAYVELDVLLDTRIATLAKLDPAAAERISKDWYHQRTSDLFSVKGSGISQTEYEAAYTHRDEETLKGATMTWLPQYLLTLISRLTTSLGQPLLSEQFTIQINVFPYDLPQPVEDSIQLAMETYTNGAAIIEIVHMRPEDLTVKVLKNNYDICFMYDFDGWLMLHTEEFKETQVPEVRVVAPRLYLKDAPRQAIAKAEKEEMVWEQMAMLFMGLVGVVFMDVRLFSFVTETHPNIEL